MKKKTMRPDNNNLDAIAKQARQPLAKAQNGGFFAGLFNGTQKKLNSMGRMASGDVMGSVSEQTGMKPEQIAGLAMKVAPMLLKTGGSTKKKK